MIRTLPALLLITVLAACGGSDGDAKADATATPTATPSATATPTPTPSASAQTPTAPKLTVAPKPVKTVKPKVVLSPCASIWKAGATLPAGYTGCPPIAGEAPQGPESCNSGGAWARFENSSGRYVAKLGAKIYRRDPNLDGNYEATYEGCTGEG